MSQKSINGYKRKRCTIYGLKPGKYFVYITRFTNYSDIVTVILCDFNGNQYYMRCGSLKEFEHDKNALELAINLKIPKYDSELYYLEQVKKDSQKYEINI